MTIERNRTTDRQWKQVTRCIRAAIVIWWCTLLPPILFVVASLITGEKYAKKCSDPTYGFGAWIQLLFILAVTGSLLWAVSSFSAGKVAQRCRDIDEVRVRAEGVQWLVLGTTTVGSACLALVATFNVCSWIGVGIVFAGVFWPMGGIAAVLVHCALVQLRLMEVEASRGMGDH